MAAALNARHSEDEALRDYQAKEQLADKSEDASDTAFDGFVKQTQLASTAHLQLVKTATGWLGAQQLVDKILSTSPLALLMQFIGKLMVPIGKMSGVTGLLRKAFDWVFKNLFKPIANFFKQLWTTVIVPAFNAAVDGVKGVISGVADGFSKVWHGIANLAGSMVTGVGEVLKDLDFPLPSWAGGGSFGLGGLGDQLIGFGHQLQAMAHGGPVRGPGGPRADRVPIMASDGEYIVNAAATAKHFDLVEAINRDRLPGDATLLRQTSRDARLLSAGDRRQTSVGRALPGRARSRLDRSMTITVIPADLDATHLRESTTATRRSMTYAASRR